MTNGIITGFVRRPQGCTFGFIHVCSAGLECQTHKDKPCSDRAEGKPTSRYYFRAEDIIEGILYHNAQVEFDVQPPDPTKKHQRAASIRVVSQPSLAKPLRSRSRLKSLRKFRTKIPFKKFVSRDK
jgi:hypothetical protein